MTKPPRIVPTLTEIVHVATDSRSTAADGNGLDAEALQRQIVQRVLHRVDVTLDRRLREAFGTLVMEQTQNLAPLLREHIEIAVRDAVRQALAQEENNTPAGNHK